MWFSKPLNIVSTHNAPSFKLVQITDLHLFESEDEHYFDRSTVVCCRRVLNHIEQYHRDCDVIVITGDVTQDHTHGSYQKLVQLLSESELAIPVLWLPGNHDDIELMNQYFSDTSNESKLTVSVNENKNEAAKNQKGNIQLGNNKALIWQDWHILLCNSKGATPAGWIETQHSDDMVSHMRCESRPHVALFCHHHPVAIDGYLDKHILENGSEWLETLHAFSQDKSSQSSIKFVAHGHVHNDYVFPVTDRRSFEVIATPATSVQFEKHTSDWQIGEQAPAYRVFNLASNGSYTNHVEWVE